MHDCKTSKSADIPQSPLQAKFHTDNNLQGGARRKRVRKSTKDSFICLIARASEIKHRKQVYQFEARRTAEQRCMKDIEKPPKAFHRIANTSVEPRVVRERF